MVDDLFWHKRHCSAPGCSYWASAMSLERAWEYLMEHVAYVHRWSW